MPSEIRTLLSAAQAAELRGDVAEAVRLLTAVAEFYGQRQQPARAEQMRRHARRLQGEDTSGEALPGLRLVEANGSDDWTLADDEREVLDGPGIEDNERSQRFARGPALADTSMEAWCSFCCRPAAEVGPLVAGPAGAFVCGGCVVRSAELLVTPLTAPPTRRPEVVGDAEPDTIELPAQARARQQLRARRPRVALIIGPEGSGKSALLRRLGGVAARPLRPSGEVMRVDLSAPLDADEEIRLIAWLEAHPSRQVVLGARGAVPTPVLVLQAEHGDEPVYDSASLEGALAEAISTEVLRRIDAVVPLPTPERAELQALAEALLAARGVALPQAAVAQLVGLAEQSGRGAHELAALLARIPQGSYR